MDITAAALLPKIVDLTQQFPQTVPDDKAKQVELSRRLSAQTREYDAAVDRCMKACAFDAGGRLKEIVPSTGALGHP